MKIKALIVEDEPAAQDVLKKYIEECPRIELAGVCGNAIEASDFLSAQDVHLIFLDINMPVLSGINFYKTLTNAPLVVFTTAYPEYALEGFEVDAVDYLLKPISLERFLKAVNKVSDHLRLTNNQSQSPAFILLSADKRVHKINFQDIFYLEGMGDYVKVFLEDKLLVVHDTLQNLETQLPGSLFMRVHRSFIISLERISYLEGNMVKIGDKLIPVSETHRKKFLEYMRREE